MDETTVTFIVRAPASIEAAVRATLRATLALRALRAAPIDPRSFANAALDEVERTMAEAGSARDAVARHEIKSATLRAAATFAASPLGRRLFRLPPQRIAGTLAPGTFDAVVRDRTGRLHGVRLEGCGNERVRADLRARAALAAAHLPGDAERFVHLFSLRDGLLRSQTVAHEPVRLGVTPSLPMPSAAAAIAS